MPSATTAKWMFILGSCLIAPALAFLGCWAYQTHLDHLDPVPVATADDGPPPWEQARHDNPYYLRRPAASDDHRRRAGTSETPTDRRPAPRQDRARPYGGPRPQPSSAGLRSLPGGQVGVPRLAADGIYRPARPAIRLLAENGSGLSAGRHVHGAVVAPGPEEGAEGRIDRMAAVWGSSLVVLWVFLLVLYRKAVREAKQPVAGSAESGAK